MTVKSPISTQQLIFDLQQLGVRPGSVLVVHTSLRNVGWISEGPAAVVRSLRHVLGPEGTLVMPTMTDSETLYDPRTTPTQHMGIVAETFWRLEGVLRSDHPAGSFAAAGPLAVQITAPQPIDPPHGIDSPIGRVYENDGWILLLGVDHSANTSIHLAENMCNAPYRIMDRVLVQENGQTRPVEFAEVNHCCRNFVKVAPHLSMRGQLVVGKVGQATAQLMRSRHLVDLACELMADDAYYFLHPPGECPYDGECDEARAYGTSI